MLETSCVYVIHDGKWLMLNRNKKPHDVNAGKWIGVGGKKKPNETMEQCALREVQEETGLILEDLLPRGIVDFSTDGMLHEKITIYTAVQFHGEMHEDREGTLAWIDAEKILDLPMWEGDRIFLKRLLDEDHRFFHLQLCYDSAGTLVEEKELK